MFVIIAAVAAFVAGVLAVGSLICAAGALVGLAAAAIGVRPAVARRDWFAFYLRRSAVTVVVSAAVLVPAYALIANSG